MAWWRIIKIYYFLWLWNIFKWANRDCTHVLLKICPNWQCPKALANRRNLPSRRISIDWYRGTPVVLWQHRLQRWVQGNKGLLFYIGNQASGISECGPAPFLGVHTIKRQQQRYWWVYMPCDFNIGIVGKIWIIQGRCFFVEIRKLRRKIWNILYTFSLSHLSEWVSMTLPSNVAVTMIQNNVWSMRTILVHQLLIYLSYFRIS